MDRDVLPPWFLLPHAMPLLPHADDAVVLTLALDDRPPRYDDVSDMKPLDPERTQARADIWRMRRFMLTCIRPLSQRRTDCTELPSFATKLGEDETARRRGDTENTLEMIPRQVARHRRKEGCIPKSFSKRIVRRLSSLLAFTTVEPPSAQSIEEQSAGWQGQTDGWKFEKLIKSTRCASFSKCRMRGRNTMQCSSWVEAAARDAGITAGTIRYGPASSRRWLGLNIASFHAAARAKAKKGSAVRACVCSVGPGRNQTATFLNFGTISLEPMQFP